MTQHRVLGRLLALLPLFVSPPAPAQEVGLNVTKVLAEMASKGRGFDPSALHRHGKDGLARLLDRLFPDTVEEGGPPLMEKEIQDLIGRLGDADAKVRQQATDRLIRKGRP